MSSIRFFSGSTSSDSSNGLPGDGDIPGDGDDEGASFFPRDPNSPMKYWERDWVSRKSQVVDVSEPNSCYDTYPGIEAIGGHLTHVDPTGRANMVDVSAKASTVRTARASARVWIGAEALRLVKNNQLTKGDVLRVAEIAGLMAAKETSRLIPLCHPIFVSRAGVQLTLDEETCEVLIESNATACGQTGVEMEALTAAAVAALTVIDMVKSVTRQAEIRCVRLEQKTGGTRGDYVRR